MLHKILGEGQQGREPDWRQSMLQEHPLVFAMGAIAEAIGWWLYQGGRAPPPEEADRAMAFYSKSNPTPFLLPERHPRLFLVLDIVAALNRGTTPPLPDEADSFMYEPLLVRSRSYAYCDAHGNALMRCGGGCGGLAHYCSKEHQRAHWKEHKKFCRANK